MPSRDLTYAAPLKGRWPHRVRYRRDTGAKSIKDIKEQDVYMATCRS